MKGMCWRLSDSRQAGGLTSAACGGVNEEGQAAALTVFQPEQAAWANRPRQRRTVSARRPVSRAIHALERPCASCSTVRARTLNRCSVLWP